MRSVMWVRGFLQGGMIGQIVQAFKRELLFPKPRTILKGFPAESGYGEQQCSPEQIGIPSTNWHEWCALAQMSVFRRREIV